MPPMLIELLVIFGFFIILGLVCEFFERRQGNR